MTGSNPRHSENLGFPAPWPHRPSRWWRKALAAAVLLAVIVGTLFVVGLARGRLGGNWLQRAGGSSTRDEAGRAETASGTGGSPLPDTRSMLPAPTPALPEAAADPADPPTAGRTPADAASKARVRAIDKPRKTGYRKPARRTRPRFDDSVEVEIF
jgi:hypothetical protein